VLELIGVAHGPADALDQLTGDQRVRGENDPAC
jgi:hypothetical protein